jgi:hypothetical protein
MSNCSICNAPLIKQPLVGNRVLTQAERDTIDRYEAANRQTLKCQECGNLCYRRDAGPNCSGLCKRCGGKDLIHRPADIEDFRAIQRIHVSMIWSCPVHGTA